MTMIYKNKEIIFEKDSTKIVLNSLYLSRLNKNEEEGRCCFYLYNGINHIEIGIYEDCFEVSVGNCLGDLNISFEVDEGLKSEFNQIMENLIHI